MERLRDNREAEHILDDVLALKPKMVKAFEADNADEQKERFMSGDINEPDLHYPSQETTDFTSIEQQLADLHNEIQESPRITQKYRPVYADFVAQCRQQNQLLSTAAAIKQNPEVSSHLIERYQTINEALYGELDTATYQSILANRMHKIKPAEDDQVGRGLYDEVLDLLPEYDPTAAYPDIEPSQDTVEAVHKAALIVYEPLLRHVPDDDKQYSPEDLAFSFDTILREAFGDSAKDWQVAFKSGGATEVVPGAQQIRINSKGKLKSAQEVRRLVVHEIGVHALRAIRGAETDLMPMSLGFAGYQDSEEGLGRVMEQAIQGEYEPSGTAHYITVGLMKHGRGFRETFEARWRLEALFDAYKGKPLDATTIDAARDRAYGLVTRIARGTDGLPWYKDLSYYKGSKAAWDYFKKYQDDELMLNLALLGKIDIASAADRAMALETKTT